MKSRKNQVDNFSISDLDFSNFSISNLDYSKLLDFKKVIPKFKFLTDFSYRLEEFLKNSVRDKKKDTAP